MSVAGSSRLKRILRQTLPILPVAGLLFAVWLLARNDADAAAAPGRDGAQSELPVATVVAERVDGYEVTEAYAGRLVSRRRSELGFERSGRLERVTADEGDRVEAGQVLAALDTRALRARRRELEAQLRETEARLELAKLTLGRRERLRESDHVSQQRLDEAVFEQAALEARLAAARAGIQNLDVALDLSEIRAPYAGSVVAREADEGTVVSPGQPILHLIEDAALEVRVGVPVATAARLRPGSEFEVVVEGRPHAARLDALLDTVEPDTRTVTAIFELAGDRVLAEGNPEVASEVRSGALARVRVADRVEASGFWLPLSALAEGRRGLWTAYAILDGRADRRQLEVLHAEADRAFVRGTLRDGELVVASGVHRLVPGQRVHATPAGAAN